MQRRRRCRAGRSRPGCVAAAASTFPGTRATTIDARAHTGLRLMHPDWAADRQHLEQQRAALDFSEVDRRAAQDFAALLDLHAHGFRVVDSEGPGEPVHAQREGCAVHVSARRRPRQPGRTRNRKGTGFPSRRQKTRSMHEPPHQRQPRQGRKQERRTSQSIRSSDDAKRLSTQSRSRPTTSTRDGRFDHRQDTRVGARGARRDLRKQVRKPKAPGMFSVQKANRRSSTTRASSRASRGANRRHQTRQDFTHFAEVFDHFKTGNDRCGDLRHDGSL